MRDIGKKQNPIQYLISHRMDSKNILKHPTILISKYVYILNAYSFLISEMDSFLVLFIRFFRNFYVGCFLL